MSAIETSREQGRARRIRALLYDADGTDREVELDESAVASIGDGQVLWIDALAPSRAQLDELGRLLELEEDTLDEIQRTRIDPRLATFGDYFHANVTGVQYDREEAARIEVDCLAGRNWVLTVHGEPASFLATFERRVRGQTRLGRLNAPSFLATLLDWHISSYFRAAESLGREIDELDTTLLVSERAEPQHVLNRLVELRRRTGELRAALAPHREVYAALAHPNFNEFARDEAAPAYELLYQRLESAIDALEHLREMVIGSFEVLMTHAAQRTNDAMRVLTVTSVLLLPPTMLAGIMSMQAVPEILKRPAAFWSALGAALVVAMLTLVAARRRGWI